MPNKLSSLYFAWAGVFAGIAGNLTICWLEWRFYKNVLTLPPGTEIRPMGLAFYAVVVGLFTFILAIPLSLAGAFFSIKQSRLSAGILSFISIVLAIIPLPLGHWLLQKIIASTGVVMEP